jgi:hypothetical protein
MAKRPAFQFYPGDWLRDTALRSCSIGARGLWIDMLCLMHEGTPYGYLKVGSKVILPDTLSKMAGAPLKQINSWVSELELAGVFSKDESGCFYSRRMVKDEQTRAARAAGGKLGGNPALVGSAKVENKDNLHANLDPTPAVAVASSSSNPPSSSVGNVEFSTTNSGGIVVGDWQTDDEVLLGLEVDHGIAVEFSLSVLDEFRDFWAGKAILLPTEWQSRFRQRVRDQWDRKNPALRSVS